MANFQALAVATARSENARHRFACYIFWMTGAVALATVAWQLYMLVPAAWGPALSSVLDRAHAAFARFYFDYLWSPVVWAMYVVAAIWIGRDRLLAIELRRYHQEHPRVARKDSEQWLAARRFGWMGVAAGALLAWVLACSGSEISGGTFDYANPLFVAIVGTPVGMFVFPTLACIYDSLDAKVDGGAAEYSNTRAYEKGYQYGRFNDAEPTAEMTANNSESFARNFMAGVEAGRQMRKVLRAKGIDVDARS